MLARRSPVRVVAVLFLLVVTIPAAALIMVGRGNTPVSDAGWPLGAVDVANLKTRIGWYEGPPLGGGQWCFLYRGDTAALNEALKALGAIRAPAGVQVVLHDGPQNCSFLGDPKDPRADTRYDWSFTVWVPESWHRLYNDPRSTFAADQQGFRNPVAPPRMDVYLTPKIDWRQVKVPDGVVVTDERVTAGAASGQAPKGVTIRADVFDMARNKPIAGAEFRAERNTGQGDAWEKVAAATTDATGRVTLAGVPAGNCRLVVTAPGFAPRMVGYDELKGGSSRRITVELSKAVRFSGTVTDDAGHPVAGMTVRADNTMGIDGRGYAPPQRVEAKSDDQGRFTLDGVPEGYLKAWGHAPGWFQVDGLKLYAAPERNPVVLHVVGTGTVRGKVVDKSGKPVGGGSVNVNPPGDPIGKWGGSMNTAADGSFEFKEVPTGTYTVSTRPQLPGVPKDPNAVEIHVSSGKVTDVTVRQ
jgi:hypothetical protein